MHPAPCSPGPLCGVFLGVPFPLALRGLSSAALAGAWGCGDRPTAALHLGITGLGLPAASNAIKAPCPPPVFPLWGQRRQGRGGQGPTARTPTTPRAPQLSGSPLLQEHPRCRLGAGTPPPEHVAGQWDSGTGVPAASWCPSQIPPSLAGTDMAVFCLLCGKRFQTQSALQQHMEVHAGVRSYICSECNRTFPSHTALKRHLRSHTGTTGPPPGCSGLGRLGQASSLFVKKKRTKGEKKGEIVLKVSRRLPLRLFGFKK